MGSIILFLFFFTIASTCQAHQIPNQILHLRPKTGALGLKIPGVNCLSWRLAVETYNLRNWKLVPQECKYYIGNYMLGKQYRNDCEYVADTAIAYAKTLNITNDGKDIWVFDIDETTLSNLPYYARFDVGAIPYNATAFNAWVGEGTSPPIPAGLRVYKTVLSLGIKVAFLSATIEVYRKVRISNLKKAGYSTWENLILKGENETGSSLAHKTRKRTELVNAGYRIVGNMGDQWNDLLGMNPGSRTFKVPDPMYYIA